MDCVKNSIADVNRCRILSSISLLTAVLQDVVSLSKAQPLSCSEQPSSSDLKSESQRSSICDLEKSDSNDTASGVWQANEATETIDPRFVQITADHKEVNRRISAFIERQRIRVNFANIQEFRGVEHNADYSCARIDAVFLRRKGSKGHIRVRRVVNKCGPQTRDLPAMSSAEPSSAHGLAADGGCQPKETFSIGSGLEERLTNLETHLKLYSGGPVPKDIYLRLQELENRVLDLESLSPEYFEQTSPVNRKQPKKLQMAFYGLTR